jgi:hypothetical protein
VYILDANLPAISSAWGVVNLPISALTHGGAKRHKAAPAVRTPVVWERASIEIVCHR